jgi:hypothetical protein
LFRQNTHAVLLRKGAQRTIYGKELYSPGVRIPCAVVVLEDRVEAGSLRADQAASGGAAEVETLTSKILVHPRLQISKGDVLQLYGRNVEVSAVHIRIAVSGKTDHLEVQGNIKGDL